MRTIAINTTAWGLALLLAGCDPDAGGGMATPEDNGRSLIFTAAIGSNGSSGLSVKTRAAAGEKDSTAISKEMDASRDSLLKKTFDHESGNKDVIRICNVESNSAQPDFETIGSGTRTFEYECDKYIGTFKDSTGTAEEDTTVMKERETYSEYTFTPHNEKGFTIGDLVTDGSNYFRFYAAWWRGYSHNGDSTKVARDQSKKDDFLNSDLLLAFVGHNINKYQDSIRLIFHHSFSMVDIRVTVPVYEEGKKAADVEDGGDDKDEEEALPSGYDKDSLKMCLTGVRTGYNTDAAADNSGGNLVNVTAMGDTVPEIPLYRYYSEDGEGHTESDEDGEGGTSKYRTYGFCGILPPQDVAGRQLLRLRLKKPLEKDKEGYGESYGYSTPDKNHDQHNGFALVGGQISVLHLKLPRGMNKMLVVQATIAPWREGREELDMMEEFGEEEE